MSVAWVVLRRLLYHRVYNESQTTDQITSDSPSGPNPDVERVRSTSLTKANY